VKVDSNAIIAPPWSVGANFTHGPSPANATSVRLIRRDVRTTKRMLRSRAQVLAGPQKASPVRAVTAVACPGEIAYAVGESQNSCARAGAGESATASVRAIRIGVFMPLLRAPTRIG
jgi:hypothetical protein